MRLLLCLAFVALALGQGADVGVSKSGPETMIIGFTSPFTYQINIANAGPSDATNVVMLDQVPAQFGIQSVVKSYANGTIFCNVVVNNLVNCSIPLLHVGDVARVLVNVTLPSNVLPFMANNTACVSSSTSDPDPKNNCNSRANPVVLSADLSINIQGPSNGIAGQQENTTDTVRIVNLGFSDAQSVTTRFKVQSPLTFQGVSSADGTCQFVAAVSEVQCNFGTVPSGGAVTYTVQQGIPPDALLPAGGDVVFWASVTSATPDPNLLNNNDTHTLHITVQSDVSVTKGSIPVVTAGQPDLTLFTIVLENAGPSNAAGVLMTDQIPAPFILRNYTIGCSVSPKSAKRFTKSDFHELSLRQGPPCSHVLGCTINGNFLSCTSDGLNLQERIVITVFVSVPANAAAQTVTNIAYVSSETFDNNQERNSDPADVTIIVSADGRVLKTGFVGSIISGDGNTYQYTVTTLNVGPSFLYNVKLHDVVPDPMIVNGNPVITSGAGTCQRSLNTIDCSFGDMAPGAQTTITIPFFVAANAATLGNIINTACITSTLGDNNPSNNCSSWANLVVAAPDVNVTKVGPGSIIVGGDTVYFYTIQVFNNGPSDALNGVLKDVVPAPFVVAGPITTTRGSCSVNVSDPNSITCDLTNLPFPTAVTIVIPFRVPPTTTVPFVSNTAYVFTTTPDRNPSNNNATFNTILIRQADIQVSKSGPATLCAGEGYGKFVVQVFNAGPTDSAAVTAVDNVPSQFVPGPQANITISGAVVGASCSFFGQQLTCNLGQMAAGANVIVSYLVSVLPSTPGGQTVRNIVNASSSTPDPNTNNNGAFHDTFICANADVQITKSGPPTATAGQGVYTYNLVASNNGPADAVNVVVSDAIPVDFTPVANSITVSPALGSCNFVVSGAVTWVNCTFGRLTPGQFSTITFQFTVASTVSSGLRTNCADISSSVNDPNTGNNHACFDTTVGLSADLAIVKSGPAQICAGQWTVSGDSVFTLTVRNNGPSVATGVVVTDTLNNVFTPRSPISTPQGSCSFTGQVLTCNLGTLAVNQQLVITFPVRVAASVPAQPSVPNTAFISSGVSDPTPTNNNSTITVNICAQADIQVLKTGPPTASAGQGSYVFTVQVTNNGYSNAVNVAVDDIVPSQFSVSGTPSATNGGSCTVFGTQAYRCTWPFPFVPGQSEFVAITFTVNAAVPSGSYTNCANATSSVFDNNLANNINCTSVPVNVQADLTVSKIGPSSICAGEGQGVYTIVVQNLGPAVATNVFVTDPVDARFVIVPGSVKPAQCSFDGSNTLNCFLGTLNVGASVTITYNATVLPTTAPASQVPNTVTVTSTTPDGTTNNNQATWRTDICAHADVGVLKSAPPTATAGDGVTYNYVLSVTNFGPATARTVTLSDDLPSVFNAPPIQNVIVTGGGSCGYAGATTHIDCTWPSILVGQTFTVTIPFTVGGGVGAGSVQNCVGASSLSIDPNPNNNFWCNSTLVSVLADVSIQKFGPSNVCAGDKNQAYTVFVTNAGPSWANTVQITDVIPNVLTGTGTPTITGQPASCSYIAGSLSCLVTQPLRKNQFVQVVFTFDVPTTVRAQNVTNTAFVTTTTPESTTANNHFSVTTAICANADLSIVKRVSASPITAGDANTFSFFLDVANGGPAAAYDVTVRDDNIPLSLFNVQGASSALGVQCNVTRNQANTFATVVCFYPFMAVGATDTITIFFKVPASATPGTYQNCASIASAVTNDPNLGNNNACVFPTIRAQADLLTTKSGPGSVTAGVNGAQNQYFVTVTNIGGSDALSSTLIDQVPADFVLSSVSTTKGTCSIVPNNVVSCSFGTLIPGQSVTVSYIFTVAANVSTQPRTNRACANTTTDESNYNNNCASVTTQVTCSAVLQISKTDNINTVTAGSTTVNTFTIVATNTGPSTSRDTVVTDTWPTAYTVVGFPTSTQGTCVLTGTGFVCTVGTLNVNQAVTITVSYTVAANVDVTSATNQVCVANSCSNAVLCAFDTNTIQHIADLYVIKDDCVTEVVAGSDQPITFTISTTNQGPSDAVNVVLTDTWPSVYVQGTVLASDGGVCTLTGRNFQCTWARVRAGQTVYVHASYTVLGTTPEQYATNCAVASSSTQDNNLINNEDCDTNRIKVIADLEVTKKIDNPDCIVAGSLQTRSYTVVVTNKGPSTALNVVLTDYFPTNLIVFGPAGCSVVGSNYTCQLGTLNKGDSVTLVWFFRADASRLPGLIENHVSVTSTTFDPELCNNNATVCSVICAESDLGVTKTDNQVQVTAGDLITYVYTIVGTNYGPSWARNVTFTDVWPAEFTRVNVSAPGGIVTLTTDGFIVTYPLLQVGQSYTIFVSYTVDACQLACQACNFVSISSPYDDNNEANNNAKDCTNIRTEANLQVCKDDGVTVVTAGDGKNRQYTIQVTNNGPSCAQKVRLVDHFPSQALMTAGTLVTTQGQCTLVGGGVQDFSCNLLTIRPGQTVTLWVNYTVPASASTCSLCNVVTVSSLTFDPELCNNDAKDCNSLIEKAQLTITKTDGRSVINGTDLSVGTYTIRVGNVGPSTARDVVVTDRWPAGFTQFLETLTTNQGRCIGVGGDFTCSLGDLPVGQFVTITVRFNNMQPPMCGTVSNWAAAFSPTDDECREAWDNTTVQCPQVSPVEVCRNCAIGATEDSAGSCHNYYATTCLQNVNCTLCYNSIKANPAQPNPVCFFDQPSCVLLACIYNGQCRGPPGQGGPCNSPEQVTVTCPGDQQHRRREVAPSEWEMPQVIHTEIKRVEATPATVFTPRVHKGQMLAAKLMSVDLKSGEKARTFKVAMKNTMRNIVEVEGLSVQVTDRNGKVLSADLSAVGPLVAKTSCARVLGSKLHANWESICEFELTETGASVKVSARGTQTVRNGYHPVMGASTVVIKAN